MGHKPKISWWGFLLIIIFIAAGVWGLGNLSKRMNPESFSKLWLVQMNGKPALFLYSTQSHPGKSSNTGYHFRFIDPLDGKVISHREIVINSWKDFTIRCLTSSCMWATIRNKWRCYKFPGFKTEFDHKEFCEAILLKFPDIGEIHAIRFLETEGEFEVENTAGELTRFSPSIFDDANSGVIDLPPGRVMIPNYFLQMGELYSYPVPNYISPEGVTISVDDSYTDVKPIFRIDEPLVEMLSHDTGFSKYYAVFMPDSTCFLMDGNKRRILQRLSKDSAGIRRENVLGNKVWLNGDFIRPVKYHAELPKTRLIINLNSHAYIYWHTSLNEKENTMMITDIDTRVLKEGWTIDLSKYGLKGTYEPIQSYLIDEILITVWSKGYRFYLTGINLTNGSLKWKFPN